MDNLDFWTFYAVTVAILWTLLILSTAFRASTSRLRNRGLKEEYVRFLRHDIVTRSLGIGIAVPLLLLALAAMVWMVAGDLHEPDRLVAIAVLFVVLVIPFPILDAVQLNRKYRALALETRSGTVVDFSYRILHLVFNPRWEPVATGLYVAFFMLAVNQGLLLYHLLNVSIHRMTCDDCYSPTVFVLGMILTTVLAAKLALYCSRYPRFTRALSR